MYKTIAKCRICGNEKLKTVLDLGNQCLTGVFPKKGEEVDRAPLELCKCEGEDGCGLVQLRHSCDSSQMYGMNYGYRSGLNASMVHHLNKITEYATRTISLQDGDIVLDIGSNDGTLLGTYDTDKNIELVGMDPTAVKFRKYYKPGISIVEDFFSAENFRRLFKEKKAKVITSIAMFYDLESPVDFAKQIAECLSDEGIWIFEQSYFPFMIQTCSFDTVCQEHLEYYTMKQIDWITREAGLKIIDVDFNNVNGGSFRITAAKEASVLPVSAKVELAKVSEDISGYNNFEVFDTFALVIKKVEKSIWEFFDMCKRENKTVLGYGASTKGNVLLQYFNITDNELKCIAEVNSDKYGHVTPGTGIPIVSEEEAKAMNPDYFFVLPWHFKNNLLEKEKDYMEKSGCRFVFALPSFDIR